MKKIIKRELIGFSKTFLLPILVIYYFVVHHVMLMIKLQYLDKT